MWPGASGRNKVLLASEENEIRLRQVKLEVETFNFESGMSRGGQVDKVKLLLQQIHDNRSMNASEKAEQVKKVREYLFGTGGTGRRHRRASG